MMAVFFSIPLFIGTPELMFILLIVVLVFGSDKLPEVAKGMGKGIRTLRDASQDIKKEITSEVKKSGIDTTIKENIESEIKKVKEDIDQLKGPIKR